MTTVRSKPAQAGTASIWFTERGISFDHHDPIVDFCNHTHLRQLKFPVIPDATHAVQQPGALGESSGGQPEFIEPLAAAGAAVGIDGLFLEVHPERALSATTTMLFLNRVKPLIQRVLRIRKVIGTI